jgi:hypothetical protein
MRRALLLSGLIALTWSVSAEAQTPIAPCAPELATAGGTAWTCPFGGIRGIVDVEGGTHTYEQDGRLDRGKLRLNLSGGEAVDRNSGQLVREAIALNPDLGGCTRIYDGRRRQLMSVCPLGFPDGGIRFYVPPAVCTDVCREVSTDAPKALAPISDLTPRVGRLERKVKRLTRRVKRLRMVLRRLL